MSEPQHDILEEGSRLTAILLANPSSFSQFTELLSAFFRGFPLTNLAFLLRHPDERVTAVALFVTDELGQRAAVLIDKVIPHVSHKNPRIRFAALNAIGSCVTLDVASAFVFVIRGVVDPDALCRKVSALLMMRASPAVLEAALQPMENAPSALEKGMTDAARLLIGEAPQDPRRVEAWMNDERPLVRKMGVIAAGRLADSHPQLLEIAATSEDSDVRMFATAEIHFLTLRRRWRGCSSGRPQLAKYQQ